MLELIYIRKKGPRKPGNGQDRCGFKKIHFTSMRVVGIQFSKIQAFSYKNVLSVTETEKSSRWLFCSR